MSDREIEGCASGFTPVFDVIAQDEDLGLAAATVFGQVWRHCQMREGKCFASRETMAAESGLSKRTFDRWLPELVRKGYLKSPGFDSTYRSRIYADTGKVRMLVRVDAVSGDETGEIASEAREIASEAMPIASKAIVPLEGSPERQGRIASESHKETKETNVVVDHGILDPDDETTSRLHDIWNKALVELSAQMTAAAFDAWLRGSQLIDLRGDLARIEVRSQYAVEWCSKQFAKPITRTLAGILDSGSLELAFVAAT